MCVRHKMHIQHPLLLWAMNLILIWILSIQIWRIVVHFTFGFGQLSYPHLCWEASTDIRMIRSRLNILKSRIWLLNTPILRTSLPFPGPHCSICLCVQLLWRRPSETWPMDAPHFWAVTGLPALSEEQLLLWEPGVPFLVKSLQCIGGVLKTHGDGTKSEQQNLKL